MSPSTPTRPYKCATLSVMGYPHLSKKQGRGFPTNTFRMQTERRTLTRMRTPMMET